MIGKQKQRQKTRKEGNKEEKEKRNIDRKN